MELREVMEQRCSVRQFDRGAPVTDEQVERLLSAALRSPSAGNGQPWHFHVVRSADARMDLGDAAGGQEFVEQAPVVIVISVDRDRAVERYGPRGQQLYALQDTACAAMSVLLTAVDLGLGSCWVGAFDEAAVADALDLPVNLRPVVMLPIGRPAAVPDGRTPRRPRDEVVTVVD